MQRIPEANFSEIGGGGIPGCPQGKESKLMSQREQLAPRAAGQLSLSSVYTNHPLTHASVNSIMIYIYFLPFPTAGYHTSIGYHRYEISHGGLQWLTLTDQ